MGILGSRRTIIDAGSGVGVDVVASDGLSKVSFGARS